MGPSNQDLRTIRSLVLDYFRERRQTGARNDSPGLGVAGDSIHLPAFDYMVLQYRIGLEQWTIEGLAAVCDEGLLEARSDGLYLTEKGVALM